MDPAKPITCEQIEQELRDLRTKLAEIERHVRLMKQPEQVGQAGHPASPGQSLPPPIPTMQASVSPSVFSQQAQPFYLPTIESARAGLPPAPLSPVERVAQAAGQVAQPGTTVRVQWHSSDLPPAIPAKQAINFEQFIGLKGMLIMGVVLVLLGGVFFLKYAIDKEWIGAQSRLLGGTIFGLGMIGVGEHFLRRQMKLFAAGLIGAGIVWLYQVVFSASPSGIFATLHVPWMNTQNAFIGMCIVTLLGIVLAMQTDMVVCAIISLAGAIMTPVLLSTGVDQQVVLMCYLLIIDSGFLALSALKRWWSLAPLALTGTILLFGGWYTKFYESSAITATMAFAWALLFLFMAYCFVGLWRRLVSTRRLTTIAGPACAAFLVVLFGASQGSGFVHGFGVQALVLALAAMAFGMASGRRVAVTGALLAVAFVSAVWFGVNYDPSIAMSQCVYGWLFLGLAVTLAACLRDKSWDKYHVANLASIASLMILGWLRTVWSMPPTTTLIGLAALNCLLLGMSFWRRWHFIRLGMLLWTAVFLVLADDGGAGLYRRQPWPSVAWVWAFYAMFLADVLVRAWRTRDGTIEALDSAIAGLASGLMFWASYGLINAGYHVWMGLYTLLLGAAAIAMAVTVRYRAGSRRLGYTLLGVGLVFVTLAAPIQFDKSTMITTLAWLVQGVVLMFIARRVAGKMLLFASPLALAAALMHYVYYELPYDGRMNEVAITVGLPIPFSLVVAAALTTAFLLAAAIMRMGKPVLDEQSEQRLSKMLCAVGAAIFLVRTCMDLPAVAATWWWLAITILLAAVASRKRSGWLSLACQLLIIACAVKVMAWDMLGMRLWEGADTAALVVMNWQFSLAIVLAALMTTDIVLRANPDHKQREGSDQDGGDAATPPHTAPTLASIPAMPTLMSLTAALLVMWAGSFEIDRFFASWRNWDNADKAMQMALSIWWGLWATAMMVIGFVRFNALLRYFAIACYGVTAIKVLFLDIRDAEQMYRILSFIGFGLLLLAGSFLYHRALGIRKQKAHC